MNFTVAILYILIVKRFELYMDFALYKINILLLYYNIIIIFVYFSHTAVPIMAQFYGHYMIEVLTIFA